MSLGLLEQALASRYGLMREPGLARRLRRRVEAYAASHAATVEVITQRALRDDQVLAALTCGLMVGETYFLRHHEQLELVAGLVRSAILDTLRPFVWSAGCATGEEPYSLAILLERALGQTLAGQATIVGTDLDGDAVVAAEAATYGSWSFRRAPVWLSAYFEPLGDQQQLTSRIRGRVRFERGNVLDTAEAWPKGCLDAVLFRNVAIYLSEEATARFHAEVARVLDPSGVLVQSPSDPPPPRNLFTPSRVVGAFHPRSKRPTRPKARPAGAPTKAVMPPTPTPPTPTPQSAPSCDLDGRADDERVWLARGQRKLAAGDSVGAIADLRSAVFLAPDNATCRLWFGIAQLESSESTVRGRGRVMLGRLKESLALRPGDAHVEDGDASVAEMMDLIDHLLEVLA